MYKLGKESVIELDEKESKKVNDEIFEKHNKNYHYFAIDFSFGGFAPIEIFMRSCPDLMNKEKEDEFFNMLIEKREVCSLYPRENLTFYPLTKRNDRECCFDMENIERHFNDILILNDEIYKTENMFVDLGKKLENFDRQLLIKYLRKLLEQSKYLKNIYFDSQPF